MGFFFFLKVWRKEEAHTDQSEGVGPVPFKTVVRATPTLKSPLTLTPSLILVPHGSIHKSTNVRWWASGLWLVIGGWISVRARRSPLSHFWSTCCAAAISDLLRGPRLVLLTHSYCGWRSEEAPRLHRGFNPAFLLWPNGRGMRVMSWTRPCPGPDWISLLCLALLLWTRRVNGLSDFSSKVVMMMMIWLLHNSVIYWEGKAPQEQRGALSPQSHSLTLPPGVIELGESQ